MQTVSRSFLIAQAVLNAAHAESEIVQSWPVTARSYIRQRTFNGHAVPERFAANILRQYRLLRAKYNEAA